MTAIPSISLFSGAGGLDIGFERAGFETLLASEFDHDAADTWRANRPASRAMVEGDVTEHTGDISALEGEVDVVFGGPPCQGFSVAGKMDPTDARSTLIWTFLDAVDATQPRVFVMENVAALARLARWEGVRERYRKRVAAMGYDLDMHVWRTSDFGVPQKRERVIFIGVRSDVGASAEDFETAMARHTAKPPAARDVLLSAGRYGTPENPQTCTANVTLAAHPVLRRSPYAGMLVNGAGRPIDLDGLPPTLPATMGGNKTPIVDESALENPSRENWFASYHAGLVAGTTSPETARVPDSMRRLTIREAALVQTFPPDYVFCGPRTKRYRQIGNAVPCLFAEAVATSVRETYFS